MSELAIIVNNLGKLYRIGEGWRHTNLREKLTGMLYAPFRALRGEGTFSRRVRCRDVVVGFA